jgi:hypothetical protein
MLIDEFFIVSMPDRECSYSELSFPEILLDYLVNPVAWNIRVTEFP